MDGCEPDGAVTDECTREYTFSGSAYIGACEDCTFQIQIEESEYTATGDWGCSSVSAPFGAAARAWPTLIHRPWVDTYAWYGHGPDGSTWERVGSYYNAVAIRTIESDWGHYVYNYTILASGSDVVISDGVISFTGSSTFYDDSYYRREINTETTLHVDYLIPDDVTEGGSFWWGDEYGFVGVP
jgi:hypothetical protein